MNQGTNTPIVKLHPNMSLSIKFDQYTFISDDFTENRDLFKEIMTLKVLPSRDPEYESTGKYEEPNT